MRDQPADGKRGDHPGDKNWAKPFGFERTENAKGYT